MHRLQPADRGEQAQRPAARRDEQCAVRRGELGDVAAGNIGDDEGAGLSGIVQRTGDRGADCRRRQMRRADAGLRRCPGGFGIGVARVTQGRRSDQHPMSRRGQRRSERDGGVQPMAVQPDIAIPRPSQRCTRRNRMSAGRLPGAGRGSVSACSMFCHADSGASTRRFSERPAASMRLRVAASISSASSSSRASSRSRNVASGSAMRASARASRSAASATSGPNGKTSHSMAPRTLPCHTPPCWPPGESRGSPSPPVRAST